MCTSCAMNMSSKLPLSLEIEHFENFGQNLKFYGLGLVNLSGRQGIEQGMDPGEDPRICCGLLSKSSILKLRWTYENFWSTISMRNDLNFNSSKVSERFENFWHEKITWEYFFDDLKQNHRYSDPPSEMA